MRKNFRFPPSQISHVLFSGSDIVTVLNWLKTPSSNSDGLLSSKGNCSLSSLVGRELAHMVDIISVAGSEDDTMPFLFCANDSVPRDVVLVLL